MSGLAVIIPVYDEAATIRDVVERTLRQSARVIVVDDGSLDGTGASLADLPVTVLRHERNAGKGASLARGIELALSQGVEAIVTLDGDGQHRPEDIPRLLAAFEQNPQGIVVGARLHQSGKIPMGRYLANRFANFWIGWAAGQRLEDSQSGFRVYPAALFRSLPLRPGRAAGFAFESEVLIDAGRRGLQVTAVRIAAIYEPRGRRSHFRPVVDVARIVRMVAWKLIARGMDLPGLLRSLRRGEAPSASGLADALPRKNARH